MTTGRSVLIREICRGFSSSASVVDAADFLLSSNLDTDLSILFLGDSISLPLIELILKHSGIP